MPVTDEAQQEVANGLVMLPFFDHPEHRRRIGDRRLLRRCRMSSRPSNLRSGVFCLDRCELGAHNAS